MKRETLYQAASSWEEARKQSEADMLGWEEADMLGWEEADMLGVIGGFLRDGETQGAAPRIAHRQRLW